MQYRPYGNTGYSVSALGIGCMRLPRIYHGNDPAEVDREKAFELIRYAADNGVNYFDSALTYHNKTSEAVLGEALEGRRQNVKIATKLMPEYMKTPGDIRRNLENTLKDLRTDYLDIYLIHNIGDKSWSMVKERDLIGEYEKLRAEGLIRAIGFSFHGRFSTIRDILNHHHWDMCQIQQNILDVDKEATEAAIRLAGEKGTAVVIMEPLRGGGLVTPPARVQAIYDEAPVKRRGVEWAFRHLLNYPEVSCILSGVTTLEQLKDNISIFSQPDAVPGCLSAQEKDILARVKAAYEELASIPCTGCEYCMPCPNNVNIPGVFMRYNEGIMFDNFLQPQRAYMLFKRGKADVSNCVSCGICESKCPQHISIMAALRQAAEKLDGWIE